MELFSRKVPPRDGNAAYLREIFRLFSEELKDVNDYTLLAMRAAADFPAAARLFDELARVELAHHTQLGQLLLRYDVAPIAPPSPRRERPEYGTFSPSDPALLERAFTARIAEEQTGAKAYRRLADTAQSQAQTRLFEQIATEEEGHAAALEGMLARMKRA